MKSKLGEWFGSTRTLQISLEMAISQPWGVVVEVLKHEMAHQYVEEVLGIRSESPHGPTYQQICREIGIDPASTGLPSSGVSADPSTAKVVERIQRLLALARSPNEHEAEAAMAAARKLMLKHNLERISARKSSEAYTYERIGEPARRIHAWVRSLASLLAEHFFVEILWVSTFLPKQGVWAQELEVMGTRSNLEMAKYVHAYLSRAAEAEWREHKKAQKIRGDRDRLQYMAGVIRGFSEKLSEKRVEEREQGLIWVGDADLDEFFSKRYPRTQTVYSGGGRLSEAYAHGKAAGRDIVLSRPVADARPGRGLALPAKTHS